jgi:hypothetical protein
MIWKKFRARVCAIRFVDRRDRSFEGLAARIANPYVANAAWFDIRGRRRSGDDVAAFAEKAMLTEPDLAFIGHADQAWISVSAQSAGWRIGGSHDHSLAAAILRPLVAIGADAFLLDILKVATVPPITSGRWDARATDVRTAMHIMTLSRPQLAAARSL